MPDALFPTDDPAPSRPPTPAPHLREKALLVHTRLCKHYDCPIPYFADRDPLSTLVSALLSHRTKNADTGRAFRALTDRFPTWESVRDAPTNEVEQAIAPATWPELKAPRIQDVLRRLTTLLPGPLSLDHLHSLPDDDIRAFLSNLPGVGPKTIASVLSFSTLRRRGLPVDSHHHRVAARLALIPPTLPPGPAHAVLDAQLPQDWTPQQVYDNHQVVMRHGKTTCTPHDPACHRCPLLDLCPHGQRRLSRSSTPPPASGPSSPPERPKTKPSTRATQDTRSLFDPP